MEVISSRRQMSACSSLNPNAPLFIPRAYQAVEDFSDEWWELVHSSPWFRDYWLQECFQDPQNTLGSSPNDDDPFLPDNIDDVFHGYTDDDDDIINKQEEEVVDVDDGKENVKEEQVDYFMDLVSLGALKWRKSRGGGGATETPKYLEKVPKFVNVKLNPRTIQQPR